MLLLLYMCYFSIFLSTFMSFHTQCTLGMCARGVWMYEEVWYRLTCSRQKQYLEKEKASCSFFIPAILCLPCSRFGLKLEPCSGGGTGSLISGWMFELHWSSSLGAMGCVTASCSSTTCTMRRKRCVQLQTLGELLLQRETVSLKEATCGMLVFRGLGTNSRVTPGTSKPQAFLNCVNSVSEITNHKTLTLLKPSVLH